MDIGTLHHYLGQLLDAGLDPKLPAAGISDGWPCEIADAALLTGRYNGDPHPKMISFFHKEGPMLALIPIGEDISDLANNKSHALGELPVEPPYPD